MHRKTSHIFLKIAARRLAAAPKCCPKVILCACARPRLPWQRTLSARGLGQPPKDGEENATYYPVNDRVAKFVVRKQYVHKEIYQCEYAKQKQVVCPVLFLE
jgi:hypothetical protein